MKETIIHHHMSALMASTAGPFEMFEKDATENQKLDAVAQYKALAALGIGLDDRSLAGMYAAMDANVLTPTVMPGNIGVPAQFLQNWLPGLVRTITQARKIDMLVGISTAGNWEDEEVIQGVLEPTGLAIPYGVSNERSDGGRNAAPNLHVT